MLIRNITNVIGGGKEIFALYYAFIIIYISRYSLAKTKSYALMQKLSTAKIYTQNIISDTFFYLISNLNSLISRSALIKALSLLN